jgi:branched-chain amino acid transport system ATP-binding protein
MQVLWRVDLVVAAGEGLGVIGRNGAGKTTLLRTIAAVHRQRAGHFKLRAQDVSSLDAASVAKRGLSIVRENAPVFGNMSVEENLKLAAMLAQRRSREPLSHADIFEIFPVLEELLRRPAALLSGGQRQMLALGVALASRPDVLLLDEPSAGLAPETAASAFRAIRRLRETGAALVIAEQNVDWLVGVASSAVRLEAGRMDTTLLGIDELDTEEVLDPFESPRG